MSDGEGQVHQPASPYVAFIYPEVVGDFVYVRDDLQACMGATRAEIAAAGGDPDDLSDIELLLEQVSARRGDDGLRTAHQRHGLRPR